MTAAEEYTAHHSESLHTIMYEWGWATFEGMFRRHLLRKAREELRQIRDLRLAAVDANSTFDMKENANAKQQRIEGLQGAYVQAVTLLSGDGALPRDESEDDPLFSETARRRLNVANQPLVPQAGMGRDLLEAATS